MTSCVSEPVSILSNFGLRRAHLEEVRVECREVTTLDVASDQIAQREHSEDGL